ncbi:MAG: D-alanyl-D-alanine carboxypeptidase, partial [Oscillospiraceae bacterium]|nr:D-alanyl-D-alanine carboxypeptidase [Oscillospiraceae bacterium]
MRKNILTTFLLFVFLVVMMQNVNAAVNISATNAIVVDAETNEIIYAKDIDSKIYPASITKLLTATILTQHKQKDDLLTYTQDASEEEPYTIIANVIPTLQVGDKFTADEVMKMLLIFSGNDMAVMIAENVAASIDDFMKEINDYAQSIGMKNSHFVTPNGLQNDDHYTTAYDLSLLMREVIKNPWIMEVLAMPTADIEFNGETYTIETRNHLLGIDGCVGGKTGQTDEAGKCLASYFEVGSRKLISVVLNDTLDNVDDETSAVFVDTLSVVQYALEQKKEPYIVKDSQVQEGTITYKPLKYFGPERTVNVGAILKDDFSI